MLESTFVFQPSPWEDRKWAQLSGLPLEEVWLPVDEVVTVFGWFINAGPNSPVFLWCHGNAGNVSHRLEIIRPLFQREISVFIFDYRGYGRSTGVPSEAGLYQDALVSYDYLIHQRQISPERLILFGRSLGAGVAGEVAGQRPYSWIDCGRGFPIYSVHVRPSLFWVTCPMVDGCGIQSCRKSSCPAPSSASHPRGTGFDCAGGVGEAGI